MARIMTVEEEDDPLLSPPLFPLLLLILPPLVLRAYVATCMPPMFPLDIREDRAEYWASA